VLVERTVVRLALRSTLLRFVDTERVLLVVDETLRLLLPLAAR
jgi:hypothetical protein